jgi:hypothetical protein
MAISLCVTTRKGSQCIDHRRVSFGDVNTYYALSRYLQAPHSPTGIDPYGYTRIGGEELLQFRHALEQARSEISEKPSSWHVWTDCVGNLAQSREVRLYAERDYVLRVIDEMLSLAQSAYLENKALWFMGD